MATLPTNYVDEILADSMNGRRHYNMTTDAIGTYLTDVTEYTQRGSTFGAAQINETNTQVNANTAAIASKLGKTDNTKDNITSFTSSDTSTSPSSFQTISLMTSGETHSSLFAKLSQAIKNIRWLNNNKRTTGAFNTQLDTVTFSSEDTSSPSSWKSVSTLTSGSTHATLLNRISAMMSNVRWLYNNRNTIQFGFCTLQWTGNYDLPGYTSIDLTLTASGLSNPGVALCPMAGFETNYGYIAVTRVGLINRSGTTASCQVVVFNLASATVTVRYVNVYAMTINT